MKLNPQIKNFAKNQTKGYTLYIALDKPRKDLGIHFEYAPTEEDVAREAVRIFKNLNEKHE